MHRFAILFTLLFALLFTISATSPAIAEDAQQVWLQAESAKTPTEAVAKWKHFLQLVPKGQTAGEGLSHDAAKLQLFHALINSGVSSKSIKPIEEAQKLSRNFDIHRMVFADTIIAKSAVSINKRTALKALKNAKSNAMKIIDRNKRNQSLHAIALAALTKSKDDKLLFGWDGPEIAEDVMPYVTLSKQRAQLMQMLAPYQTAPSDKWGKKLYALIKISKKSDEKKRNTGLLNLYKEAVKADKFDIALDALSASTDFSKQQEALNSWFKKTFNAKQYSRADMIAKRISDGRYAANSLGKLAEHFHKSGEKLRAKEAAHSAYEAALSTRRGDRKMRALLNVAELASNSGNPDIAQKALKSAGMLEPTLAGRGTESSISAIAHYIKALAENGQYEQAAKYLSSFAFSNIKLSTIAASATAKAAAEIGKPEEAIILLDERRLSGGKSLDKAYYAIAKAFVAKNKFDKALQASKKITDRATRLKSEAYIESKKRKADKNNNLEKSALDAPFFSSLDSKIKALPVEQQETTRIELTELLLDEPNMPIKQWSMLINSKSGKDDMIALHSIHLAKAGKIEESARLMKSVDEPIKRTRYFRKLAVEISLHTDKFGFIGNHVDPIIEQTRKKIFSAADATQLSSKDIEKRFAKMAKSKERGVEMVSPKSSDLGLKIPDFDFPERLQFDYKYVKALLPALTPFVLNRVYYENSFFINTKFKLAINYSDNNIKYGNITPEVLYLASGVTTLPLLYDYLKSHDLEGYITKRGKEYTLNNGLLVGPNATLIIDGDEVSKLYQSKQASAILVNAGSLYITGTTVIGWDMEKQAPAFSTYKDKYDFRPFIAGFSRSHTYLAGNEFIALGYSAPKSYAISLSAGPGKLQDSTITEPRRPDGLIVDNSFNNLYYGFYAYEADDVALIGNEYKNNIIYGIDPHDRSRRLTIAYNTAYGSQKKHGIIISREVTNSSYVGNLTFDNKGSGFMIDRLSTGTFVYGNTAFGNKQDGLTIFESSCNYVASNNFFNNKSLGIRVRNSQDNGIFFNVLSHNRQGGITAYISELLNDPAHKHRNFTLDPYSDVAAMSMVGNKIEDNGMGIVANGMSAILLRGNRFIDQSPKMFGGDWFTENSFFTSQYDIKNKGVYMAERCPKGKWIHHNCRFRKDGFYKGDGQSDLENRVTSSSCQIVSKQDAKH